MIIDFETHPVVFMRNIKQSEEIAHKLLDYFIEADNEKKLIIIESLRTHQGDCAILVTDTDKRPLCYWFTKSEDVGEAVLAFKEGSFMVESEECYLLFHITDDGIFGFGTLDYGAMLQFAAAMPRANWCWNINN